MDDSYDLNGCQNRGGTPQDLLQQFPLFDKSMAPLAPAVVETVQSIAGEVALSSEDIRELYLKSTAPTRFPLAPNKTWSVLLLAIEGKIDLDNQPSFFQQIRCLL